MGSQKHETSRKIFLLRIVVHQNRGVIVSLKISLCLFNPAVPLTLKHPRALYAATKGIILIRPSWSKALINREYSGKNFDPPPFPMFSKKGCSLSKTKSRQIVSISEKTVLFLLFASNDDQAKKGQNRISCWLILELPLCTPSFFLFLFIYFSRKRVRTSKISAGSAICPQQVTKIISLAHHVSFFFFFFFLREK